MGSVGFEPTTPTFHRKDINPYPSAWCSCLLLKKDKFSSSPRLSYDPEQQTKFSLDL